MDNDQRKIKTFGFGAPAIFFVLAGVSVLRHGLGAFSATLFVLAAVILYCAVLNQDWLKIIYKYWMMAAHKIGKFLTSSVLILFYYLIFAPLGILFRLIKKDFLNRSLDPDVKSYWHIRPDVPFNKERCTKQF